MIELNILTSSDKEMVGNYRFNLNHIYIGKGKVQLPINEPEMIENHFFLEVIEESLYIHPNPNIESFLLNGKRCESFRKLSIGDEIVAGETTIKISSFLFEPATYKREIINQKLNELVEKKDPKLKFLKKLESTLQELK